MKEIILKIPNKHYDFFNELIEQLEFVEKIDTPTIKKSKTSAEHLKNLKIVELGLKEMQLVNQRKLKTKPTRQLLNEI